MLTEMGKQIRAGIQIYVYLWFYVFRWAQLGAELGAELGPEWVFSFFCAILFDNGYTTTIDTGTNSIRHCAQLRLTAPRDRSKNTNEQKSSGHVNYRFLSVDFLSAFTDHSGVEHN